jgi:hypothetical protein
MLRRIALSVSTLALGLTTPAMADDPPVTPIPGCGSVVVLETGSTYAAPQGQENIAEHVPVACAT